MGPKPTLGGELNYVVWRSKILMILGNEERKYPAHKYKKWLEEKYMFPDQNDPRPNDINIVADSQHRTLMVIYNNVSNQIILEIGSLLTGSDMFNYLETKYNTRPQSSAFLREELYNLSLSNDVNLSKYA